MAPETRKRIFRFDPTVSAGIILQMLLLAFGAIGAYGTYRGDQERARMELEQVKANSESRNADVKETLSELKGEVKNISANVDTVSRNVAVIQAMQQQQTAQPRKP